MLKFFLAFTLIPLIELALLIKIGGYLGVYPTIVLVVITGGIGVFLAKNQGFLILSQIQADLQQNILPGDSILSGLLVLVGSVFLITPGLITDLAGFLLLIPFTRNLIREWLKIFLKKYIEQGKINLYYKKY